MAENQIHEVEVTTEQKGVIKFGAGQLQNPTPKWAKNVFKGVLFVAVLWSFLAPTVTEIPQETIEVINTWSLRSVGFVRIAIAFFGLDYKEQ